MKYVPRYRLLFSVATVFLPMAVLSAVVPATIEISICLVLGLAILSLIDMQFSRDYLAGVRVFLPDVVRLSKGRKGHITVTIEDLRSRANEIRIGLAYPKEIITREDDITILPPEQGDVFSFQCSIECYKHGQYIIENCYLETYSSMGFWAIRGRAAVFSEIRVYPNLFIEQKNLTALFLNRGVGVHTQRIVGKGRDFEQLREYLPGDSYEDIHWKATAKRGQPVTKVYQIERTQQIYVIIDSSRLSTRNTVIKKTGAMDAVEIKNTDSSTILERYITAALITALAAERQGDLFGLLTFDDQVKNYISAKNGKAHYNACRDALYTLEPKSVSPDFTELFTFIGSRIRRRSLLLFLTHLDDPVLSENFIKYIDIISRRHLVLVSMLKPEGTGPVFSSSSVSSVDDIYRSLGGHLVWKHLHETEKKLYRHGVDFSWMENEHLCTELVSKYLSIKQRQIL